MTTYAYLEPWRERIDKATCEGCRQGLPKTSYKWGNWHQCVSRFEELAPILAEIVQAAEQAATEKTMQVCKGHMFNGDYFRAVCQLEYESSSTSALAEYRAKVLKEAAVSQWKSRHESEAEAKR